MNDVAGNQIAALLIPTAVTLVTAYDEDLEACVATIAWVMPISHDPSIIAVSIRPDGRTSNAMASSGCFVVNTLPATEEGARIAVTCGKKSGVEDRFAEAHITAIEGCSVKAPRVEEAVSWIECELIEHAVHGDHELFLGKTVCAQTRSALSENGTVDPDPVLLMGQRGHFGTFQEQ